MHEREYMNFGPDAHVDDQVREAPDRVRAPYVWNTAEHRESQGRLGDVERALTHLGEELLAESRHASS